jgi:hypothetical protein
VGTPQNAGEKDIETGLLKGDINIPARIHNLVPDPVPDVNGEPDTLVADGGAVPVPTVRAGVVIPQVVPTAVVVGVKLDEIHPGAIVVGLSLDNQWAGADDGDT